MAEKLSDFEKFCRWDAANPEVYDMFKSFAQEALDSGVNKIGAWLIAGRLRWQTDIVTRGASYKMPNGFIAYLARLWVIEHPQHAKLFSLRKLKTPIPAGALELHLAARTTV